MISGAEKLRQLVELVTRLRGAQKIYFATRSPAALEESRKIERAVDRWLKEHEGSDQRTLF